MKFHTPSHRLPRRLIFVFKLIFPINGFGDLSLLNGVTFARKILIVFRVYNHNGVWKAHSPNSLRNQIPALLDQFKDEAAVLEQIQKPFSFSASCGLGMA